MFYLLFLLYDVLTSKAANLGSSQHNCRCALKESSSGYARIAGVLCRFIRDVSVKKSSDRNGVGWISATSVKCVVKLLNLSRQYLEPAVVKGAQDISSCRTLFLLCLETSVDEPSDFTYFSKM